MFTDRNAIDRLAALHSFVSLSWSVFFVQNDHLYMWGSRTVPYDITSMGMAFLMMCGC